MHNDTVGDKVVCHWLSEVVDGLLTDEGEALDAIFQAISVGAGGLV